MRPQNQRTSPPGATEPADGSRSSVTEWIGRLKAGDPDAAERLWERYFRRLVGLARKKLRGRVRRIADAEDVVLDVFDSLWRGAREGRFPLLKGRHELWDLVFAMTENKALQAARDESRLKRGGPSGPLDEQAMDASPGAEGTPPGLGQVPGREPMPDEAAAVAEQVRRLLDVLGDAELRSVAEWKLIGHTNDDIARKLGRSQRAVERKLQTIRAVWKGVVGHE
jgi:RNA polymerase sigma factor (sigma-70 family)